LASKTDGSSFFDAYVTSTKKAVQPTAGSS
jgi:hypothetical protein